MKNTIENHDRFPTGVLTVSLDFELLWGAIDRSDRDSFRKLIAEERARVIDGLLDLVSEFRLPATWCIVGQLFLDRETATAARRSLRTGTRSNDARLGDWKNLRDEELYARDLVGRIYDCPVPQEIGGHGFTHLPFTDLMSSRSEGLPMALLQTSAATLPIVATDVGGNSAVAADHETGDLVRSADPEALAAAMLRVTELPVENRLTMGAAGRSRTIMLFSEDRVAWRWEELYSQLCWRRVLFRSCGLGPNSTANSTKDR